MTSQVLWIVIIVLLILIVLSNNTREVIISSKATISSPSLSLNGDCGYNILAALNANNNALRSVTINPGDTFSFNATMGNPELIDYKICSGIPGGNWCGLASAYALVARNLGLNLVFQDHGFDLGFGRENAVSIWNISGTAGFDNGAQDLLITNNLNTTVYFYAIEINNAVYIKGEK